MKAFKKLLAAGLALALPLSALAQATPPAEPAKPAEQTPPAGAAVAEKAAAPAAKPAEEGVKVTPYGFVLLNAFWDTETFATKDYPGQVQAGAAEIGGAFLMSARQSRFGVRLASKEKNWTGAEFSGVIEFDFKAGHVPTSATCVTPAAGGNPVCTIGGGNTASSGWYNGLMRLRLAAATATWKTGMGNVSILAGQEYGLVNPLFADSLAWVADPLFWQAGNLWRRSPQIRLTVSPVVGPLNLTGQVAILSPADAGTPVDFGQGNRSRQPDFEARVAANLKPMKDVSATVGVGYHTNEKAFQVGTTRQYESKRVNGIGVDAEVNVPFLTVKGEYYNMDGLDDTYFGIATPSAALVAGDVKTVNGTGYWGQAILKLIPEVSLQAGFGRAEADAGDLTAAGAAATARKKNDQLAAGVIFNAGKSWRFGAEWIRVETTYLSGVSNEAQQLAVSSQLKF
ncbi:hypothetical protein [Anaeromyxobacter terrae]|uniref:hypothetical protein n=1 Tax=Anaeromyxobacter terrae TaxID=2925406 RepID=UPI001F55DAD1|nr:hypothetical protein [Anaeromyxobacter sp. SG22]